MRTPSLTLALGLYKDLLRACPHRGFTELQQLDTFYNALNPSDQDSLISTARGNLLERCTHDMLTIFENKSKVRNSQKKSILSQVKYSDANSSSSSEIAKLTHAVNQQTSAVTTSMTDILKQFQATPPPAYKKAVEEICVTYGCAHLYYQCSGSLPRNTIANPKDKDKLEEETLMNPKVSEFTIKVPPPLVQKPKPPSQRNFMVHQRILFTLISLILQGCTSKSSKKNMKSKFINFALLSNKEKLLELENTPLNENSLAVILKKLPEKLGDPRKFLIMCGFSKLKCKDLANLGASINLMPLSVWKKLGLPELISTGVTLELANRAICTPAGIARDVLVPLGKFTFPANFVIVDYESDPRVPLILGRPFLRTARALIDVHGEEMILYDEIEYLLNHDPIKEIDSILKDSIDESNLANLNDNLVDTMPEMFIDKHALDYSTPSLYDEYDDDVFEGESSDFLPSSEYNSFLLEDFSEVDALPSTNNEDKVFNPGILIQENPFEFITRVAPDKNVKKLAISHASLILEDFDLPLSLYKLPFLKDVLGFETLLSFSSENKEKVFKPGILNSKGVHSSLLLELSHRDFSRDDVLFSPDNEDKVFNPGILSHGKSVKLITRFTQEKKLAVSFASWLSEDFDPPFSELLVFKEVPNSMRFSCFQSQSDFLKPDEDFHVQNGKNTPLLDVLLFYFYPP
uniref:Reverse transcriptase domain-containing protein n=1 Tax=Tanacetum cinerariifolium TaxID=118510 RepID=A0A6L2M3N5_TANCI|nr:reverse transcriptase domain-containing protein [Tanacetum cinerariifolium]